MSKSPFDLDAAGRRARAAEGLRERVRVEAFGHAAGRTGACFKRSYSARFFASPSIAYASLISLKRSVFFLSSPVTSGCSSLASLRYAFLIVASSAFSATPNVL